MALCGQEIDNLLRCASVFVLGQLLLMKWGLMNSPDKYQIIIENKLILIKQYHSHIHSNADHSLVFF